MAYTTTTSLPLKLPVPGSREPAQIALINENMTAVDGHDHTTGKGVAIGRMRSGLQANRPAAGQAGNVYFATDAGKFYVDSGAAWVEFLTTGGTSTITGWTLVDPIIRDTLQFGPEPTGTPDATLSRTGPGALRVDSNLGLGVDPPLNTVPAAQRALRIGSAGALYAFLGAGNPSTYLSANSIYPGGASSVALHETWPGALVTLTDGTFAFANAPAVAAGAAQTFTTRASIAKTGTLTLTPDAGQKALVASSGTLAIGTPTSVYTHISGASVLFDSANGLFYPERDNTQSFGAPANRLSTLYAVAGAINTSSAAVKEGITPLDPAACYQAAKDVRWYEFAYLPPAYQEPEPPPDIAYDAADDNETKAEKKAKRDEAEAASKAAHLKMVAETAPARNQRGFVFGDAQARDEAGEPLPPVPALFGLSDRQSTTPQADIATIGAALQHLIARVEALEAASGQAPA